MDFEIDDGLEKLDNSKLLSHNEDGITALPLDEANTKLMQQWNHLIQNNARPNNEEYNNVDSQ